MTDAAEYTVSIRRGIFEGEDCFEARVREFPDVAEYGDSYEEAYQLAIDTIETTAQVFSESGREMPAPMIPAEEYSGRVTLRIPKTLHRDLVLQAEDDGVSLNQHIVNSLSYSTGYSKGVKSSYFEAKWNSFEAFNAIVAGKTLSINQGILDWASSRKATGMKSTGVKKSVRPVPLKAVS